jgi:two-component system, NarL family, sensor kinase
VSAEAGKSSSVVAIREGGDDGHPFFPTDVQAGSTRWLAILRVLLLPIVFAGDRLVAHPKVGTAGFNLIFGVACIYSVVALIESRRRRAHPPLWLFASLDLALVCALTYESGGAFSQLHWAFLFLPLGAAILLDPRRTATVSVITAVAYLVVALIHPSTQSKQLDLVLVQTLYIAWVGVAAVVLSSLLARRQARIMALAAERGSLVAQALAAEDRARHRLADGLHDSAIQNLLAARQDLAEARVGEREGIDRAERALRLTLDQLRTTVRELHPYVLEQLGLESGLETVAGHQARSGGYAVELRIDANAVGVCDQLIFSLARELLANVTRHANATRVTVELSSHAREIVLTVSDDGCGFEQRQLASSLRRGHIGLASCRERVHAVRGGFDISRPPGGGTTVRCVIPREAHAAPLDRTADYRSPDVTPRVALTN